MFGFPFIPVLVIFAGLLDFAIVGGIYLYVENLKKKCNEVRRKWPQVKGKILSSRLEEKRGEEMMMYSPAIRFEYTHNGTRYESDRCTVYPKWSSSDREPHRKFVARFPRDLEVDVWVNPRNPADAVLTTDPPGKSVRIVQIILCCAGIVTILVGVAFAIYRPHFPG